MDPTNPILLVILILLVIIAVTLYGILTAIKSGFNQIIRGLESVDQAASRLPPAPPAPPTEP